MSFIITIQLLPCRMDVSIDSIFDKLTDNVNGYLQVVYNEKTAILEGLQL